MLVPQVFHRLAAYYFVQLFDWSGLSGFSLTKREDVNLFSELIDDFARVESHLEPNRPPPRA